jgi:glycosyltransferase involved in cell wall biosynthesis
MPQAENEATPDLSIVMPVFNEATTVREAVQQILDLELPIASRELIVVDDGSTDATKATLNDESWPLEVRLFTHERNQGKGAAVRTGLTHARGRFAVVVDADLELDVSDLARLLPPLFAGEADAVFGARIFPKGSARKMRYWIGNRGVSIAANMLFGGSLADVMTCFKAMSTDLFRSLNLRERGFGIEAEVTARLMQTKARIIEIPVHYEPRPRKAGKKLTMLDGVRVLRTLIRCRLSKARVPAKDNLPPIRA